MSEELTVSSELLEGRGRRAGSVLSARHDVLTSVQSWAILDSDRKTPRGACGVQGVARVVGDLMGQYNGGRPVARKSHAGKYGELTPLRQRGGRGFPSPLPSCQANLAFLEG
jgi:hypothetical protein